jgi:hypothetical protein
MYRLLHIPTAEEFIKGCEEYKKHEKRDAMYKIATYLICSYWGNPSDMADGLGVLLLTWNQAFYRYGIFDFDKLEACIVRNFRKLEILRWRDISTLSDSDEKDIKGLFNEFFTALAIQIRGKIKSSPVAVGKALHLLAPSFFPLWDNEIARAYGCSFKNPAESYVSFCYLIKHIAEEIKKYTEVKKYMEERGYSLLKLIDEYNFSKYTKKWI